MKYLPYERIAQLVTIAAFSKNCEALGDFLTQLNVSSRTISVKFSDYVKSQIHLNISYSLYGREISEYVKASYFIAGDRRYQKIAQTVLGYFYSDMANFLINNSSEVDLRLEVDCDLDCETVEVDLDAIVSDLNKVLCNINSEGLPELIKQFRYGFIFDSVEDLDDAKSKIRSYALAAVLQDSCRAGKICKVRLHDETTIQ